MSPASGCEPGACPRNRSRARSRSREPGHRGHTRPCSAKSLHNLIDNALSYCPDGAHITIRVDETPDRGVYLEVEDDGPGIPEHLRDDAFGRFVRLDPDIGQGCGLGLSIVKEITKVHSGEVRLCAPHSGTGLVVRVELPRVQRGRLAQAQPGSP